MITFNQLYESLDLNNPPEVFYEIFTPELFIRHDSGDVTIITEQDSKTLNETYNKIPNTDRNTFIKDIKASKENIKKYIGGR